MSIAKTYLILLGLAAVFSYGVPSFVGTPVLKDSAGQKWVQFTLSESTDVEVGIVDTVHHRIVRHLAAGMLGPNAPAPLVKGTRSQSLAWDGADDFGVPVPDKSGLTVRVRAGMQPKLDTIADQVDERGVLKSNRYFFGGGSTFFGMALDSAGILYILGTSSCSPAVALRAYDGNTGAYIRTVIPFPANLDRNLLVPYEIVLLGDKGYNIGYNSSRLAQLRYNAGPLTSSDDFSGVICPDVVDNRILAFNYNRMTNVGQFTRYFNTLTGIGLNSALMPMGNLIKSPALAPLYSGPLYLTRFPGNKSVLMSGIYGWVSTGGSSGWGTGYPMTTGFWRDGQVFKIDMAAGVATPFIALNKDSLPSPNRPGYQGLGPDAAINGVTVDNSGHVFICDRMHGQIGIYDTSGTFIKGIPQANPDIVEVNKKTGELYVVVKGVGVSPMLKKFSDWHGSPAVVVSSPFPGSGTVKACMVVSQTGDKPVVWLSGQLGDNYNDQGIWGFRDDGSAFTLISSFHDSAYTGGTIFRDAWSGFLTRMDADPNTEQVFVTDNFLALFKVEDWSRPVLSRCSTSTGQKMNVADVQVGPDGCLYVQQYIDYFFWIARYTMDHLHAPVAFAGKGNTMVDSVSDVNSIAGSWYGGLGTKGFAVAPGGKTIFLDRRGYALWDSTGKKIKDQVLSPMLGTAASVQFDRKGFLYAAGGRCYPAGMNAPAGYGADPAYLYVSGAIGKFDINGTAKGGFDGTHVYNALTVYTNGGIAPFSQDGGSACICRNPRFDVDAYGRLFIPNGISGSVTVLDNANNLLMRFGEYGNCDSKGQSSLVPITGVPLMMPMAAAASENYIYVSDDINCRLVRVKMDYQLNSLPEYLTTVEAAKTAEGISLLAYPNPFNPEVSIIVSGIPSNKVGSLRIYNAEGRMVSDFGAALTGQAKTGVVTVRWNAKGLSSGMYVVKVVTGNKVLIRKMILAK